MFARGEIANPSGAPLGVNQFREKLLKALNIAGKKLHTTPEARIAEMFFKSDRSALQILPYIAPRLRALEVSGEVSVPFLFIIERSSGETVDLPQPVKQIASQVVAKPTALRVPIAKAKTVKARRKPAARAKRKRTND